jgi:hypothetical protein
MMVAGEIADLVTFASADEATKPIDASDKVSASIFFMLFPFSQKNLRRAQPQPSIHDARAGEHVLIDKTPVQSKELQAEHAEVIRAHRPRRTPSRSSPPAGFLLLTLWS